ncbi:unnamed protein product [Allacma fusca]|uniref:Coiled-coil domain-containing protein 22 homolog n=1 Tax=Allacma fusca TaxID=39272 RepID=A0A8J2LSM3_9HEXA|nr:unnamed protein product [Allacma fusca]
MEEVDSILIYTLEQIGCDVNTNVAELSPLQIIKCVTRCLQLARPDMDIPAYDGATSMSGRYKVASQLAQLVTDLGYKEEIGCQSFLYPSEGDTRKLLIFMVEKLPRDIDSEVGDKIEVLLSKIAKEAESKEEDDFSSGIEVGGIRLPAAINVDALPKESMRFYASHLAELSFAKQREKFKHSTEVTSPTTPVAPPSVTDTDDDFGDPDEPEVEIVPEITKEVPVAKPRIKEKPKVAEKVIKPPIKEKPKLESTVNQEEAAAEELARNEQIRKAAEEAAEVAARTKALQENTKSKVKLAKQKDKAIHKLNQNISTLEDEVSRLRGRIEAREKDLDRQRKTHQLLSGSEDGLDKVKNAVDSQMEKLLNLANQWENHRQPLIDEIRHKRADSANKISETAKQREEIRSLKAVLKEMGQEAKEKVELYSQLMAEYEKMPKDLNRSAYTRRICEIIGNIKKQKREITKVITDTKAIQKDINTLSGRLDRTFAVADELIYKDAEKDKNVAQSYKLLVSIHSDFSRIIKTLEETGNSKRLARDLEDKVEAEKAKHFQCKLDRLQADLTQMKKENQILQATLRDPSIARANNDEYGLFKFKLVSTGSLCMPIPRTGTEHCLASPPAVTRDPHIYFKREIVEILQEDISDRSAMTETDKSKRPADSAFKQQRLAAWQPILTAGTVLPTFFVIGILFIPVGIGLLFFSDSVNEITKEYTHCIKAGTGSGTGKDEQKCSDVIANGTVTCECAPIQLEITEALKGKVYIYYALTNFYQNHRRYVKSRDDKQLLGQVGDHSAPVLPDEACNPFRFSTSQTQRKIIFPCGAIANSMFNDVILLYKDDSEIPLSGTGIAWETDKKYKFKNPSWWNEAKNNPNHPAWQTFVKPIAWKTDLWNLTDGIENEDFIVWMRTAALPNFRKLYRIVNHDAPSNIGIRDGLPPGNYTLKITYSFPVTSFQGTKSVVISTTALLGGKNPFLGISYIVVGAICLILGIVFLFIHINYGKSTWEMTHVDPRTPYN